MLTNVLNSFPSNIFVFLAGIVLIVLICLFFYRYLRRRIFARKLPNLSGKVALVTGASRGLGRGIAIELGNAGCTVYVTGKSTRGDKSKSGEKYGGTIDEVAEYINEKTNGVCYAVKCNHYNDDEVEAAIDHIIQNEKRIDILVNISGQRGPFWKQPLEIFDSHNLVGMRSHYFCAWKVVPYMLTNEGRNKGLIVNISSLGEEKYFFNVSYGIGKSGIGRMMKDMGYEFRKFKTGITCFSLWPGLVKTERNIFHKEGFKNKFGMNVEKGETSNFSGIAIAHVCNDKNMKKWNGKTGVTTVKLARHYNFTDVDGKVPSEIGSFGFYVEHGYTMLRLLLSKVIGKRRKKKKE